MKIKGEQKSKERKEEHNQKVGLGFKSVKYPVKCQLEGDMMKRIFELMIHAVYIITTNTRKTQAGKGNTNYQ